jgi:hypothetical protein
MPPEEWWKRHAKEIVDVHFSSTDIHNFYTLRALAHRHIGEHGYSSFGHFIPNKLPSHRHHSAEHAYAILYAAIVLDLVICGLTNLKGMQPSGYDAPSKTESDVLCLAYQIESLAKLCYEHIEPFYSKSRGINSSTFVNTSIESACAALTSYSRFLDTFRQIEEEGRATRIKKQKEEEHMQQQYEERLATQRAGQASLRELLAGGKPRSFWPPRFSNCIVVDQLVDTSSGTTKPAPYVVQHLHTPCLHHPPVPSHHPHPPQPRLHLLLSNGQQKSLPIPSAIEVSIHQNGRGGSPNAFDNTTVVLAADLHHVLGEALSNPLQLLFPHPSSTQLISNVPPLQQLQLMLPHHHPVPLLILLHLQQMRHLSIMPPTLLK